MPSLYPGHGHVPYLCQLRPGVHLQVLVHQVVRKQQLLDGAASGPTAEGGQRVFGVDRKGPKFVFLKIICYIDYIAKMLYIARDHDQAEGQWFPWFEQDYILIPNIFKSS